MLSKSIWQYWLVVPLDAVALPLPTLMALSPLSGHFPRMSLRTITLISWPVSWPLKVSPVEKP
jgi:hypothetical protein